MRFFCTTNLVFIAFLVLGSMPGEKQQTEAIHLKLLLLPVLLLKLGLAAPVVLAILVKLLLLLGLGKAVLVTSLLGGARDTTDSHETKLSSGYGAPHSTNNLGRIKRSVDFVQGIVGKADISEEQLLETIFSLDTRRCGEKLLCEVAASVKSQSAARGVVDEEEAAMVTIFGQRRTSEGPAQKAYKDAVISGLERSDCASRYPTCPFERSMMMHLVHLVTETVTETRPKSSPSTSAPKKEPSLSRQENERNLKLKLI